MPDDSPNAALIRRLEQQLAQAGLQVVIERSDGALVLSGIVASEESRQAAQDIVDQAVPDATIDNQIEIQSVFPTDVDEFVSDDPTAELPESLEDIRAGGGEVDPDFTERAGLNDPINAAGPESSELDDPASSGEVYTPPVDPVITTDAHGAAHVLGGFAIDSAEDVSVEPSTSDGAPGDEALADAIRRELAEDAATTDLEIVVAVRRGVAHLRGRVPDLEDADNAEEVAGRVPGVREVVEELDVDNV